MRMLVVTFLVFLSACATHTSTTLQVPPHAVIGVDAAQLESKYWIDRTRNERSVVLDAS